MQASYISEQAKSSAKEIGEQIVIMHRSTDQMMVVSQSAYHRHLKTKYRNWRLYGQSKLIEVPLTLSSYLQEPLR